MVDKTNGKCNCSYVCSCLLLFYVCHVRVNEPNFSFLFSLLFSFSSSLFSPSLEF